MKYVKYAIALTASVHTYLLFIICVASHTHTHTHTHLTHTLLPWCGRTRRSWKPNVQNKRLYSEALDQLIQLRVTTTALRYQSWAPQYQLCCAASKLLSCKQALELTRAAYATLSMLI